MEFEDAFRRNILKRSRTAKGTSNTTASVKKQPLLKSGDALAAQVERNTGGLVKDAWLSPKSVPIGVSGMRSLTNRWYDIMTAELQDPRVYEADFERVAEAAARLAAKTGKPHRANPRYRVWNPEYLLAPIEPPEIEVAMDAFYAELDERILRCSAKNLTQAELLAFADHTIESVIHPWADGCGRIATTMVMWLSLIVPGFRLPEFGERDEHYANIRDLVRHTEYFVRCLGGSAPAKLPESAPEPT